MSVATRRTHLGLWPVSYAPLASVGSYGWPGIYGTGWCNDPAEGMTPILMIQRAPAPPGLPILFAFWTAAYRAIDD
jgi:CubicO group peptidase (beta-lactamase class C family)